MRYYVMADLHGRFDLLKKAYDVINNDIESPDTDYKVITLGDYIDRGPQSKQIIDFLIEASQYPDTVCLKGNHEDMAVQCVEKNLHPDWWVGNGGRTTLESYGWNFKDGPYTQEMYSVFPKEHYVWMKDLPLYLETEKQVFVHAGIPQSNMSLPPSSKHLHRKAQLEEQMLWMLYDKSDGRGWKGKHVVHGHHQFADGPHVWQGRTDLDCYAWRTGRLVIGVFDDTQGPAKKFLEVLGDDYGDQRTGID